MAGGVAGTLSFVINATTEGVDKAFKAIQAGAGKVSNGFTAISDGIRNTFNMAGARDQLKAVNRQIRDMDRQIQSMSGRKLELNNQIGELNTQLEEAQNNLEHLQESGGSQEEINQQRSMIAELEAARNSAQREVARIGRMQDRRNQLETTRSSLQSQMDTPMGRIGGAIGAIAKVGGAVKAVGDAMKKTSSLIGKGFGNVKKVVSGVLGSVKKAVSAISKPIKIASSFAKKGISSFKGMGQAAGGVGEKAKSMLKSLIQFKLLGTIFSKIKGYFSDLTNSSWELKNATKELNGSFKTAMQPLYEIVAPIVLQIINLFNKATQAIATFFASLGGKSYQQLMQSAQALDKQKKAIAGAGGELQRQLMGFDELNILTEQSGSSDSIFNEEELGALGDLAEELANLWQNGEYAEFGRVLAEQVNEFTASLINMDDGVSMVGDIGARVGKLLYGIVTAAESFFSSVEWRNIGEGIAQFLNKAIENLDGEGGSGWETLGKLLSAKMGTLLGIITGFLTGTGEEGQDGFDFGNLGDSLGKMLEGYFEGQYEYVSKYLTGDFWNKFKRKITMFFTKFKLHIKDSVKTAGQTIVEQIPEILDTAGTIADGILDWINTAIQAVNEAGDDGLTLAERLGKSVATGIEDFGWDNVLAGTDGEGGIAGAILGLGKAFSGFVIKATEKLNSTENGEEPWSKQLGHKIVEKLAEEDWYGTIFGDDGITKALEGLGETLHNFISGALDEMDVETDGKTRWQQIGESIAGGINGINWESIKALINDTSRFVLGLFDVLITAIGEIDWQKVGQHLWDMFWAIDWMTLVVDIINLLAGLGAAIVDIVAGCIDRLKATDWKAVGESVKNGLAKITWGDVLKTLVIGAGFALGGPLGAALAATVIGATKSALQEGARESTIDAMQMESAIEKGVNKDLAEMIKNSGGKELDKLREEWNKIKEQYELTGDQVYRLMQDMLGDEYTWALQKAYYYLEGNYDGTLDDERIYSWLYGEMEDIPDIAYEVGEDVGAESGKMLAEGVGAGLGKNANSTGAKSGSDSEIDPDVGRYVTASSVATTAAVERTASEVMENANIEQTVESEITAETLDAVSAALQNPELTGKLTDLGKILVDAFTKGLNTFNKENVLIFQTQTWAEIALGIATGFETVKNGIRDTINAVFEMINTMNIRAAGAFNLIGEASTNVPGSSRTWTTVTFPAIPCLAKGAVIPANREFLAVLGDQKSGTNIEAPLTTIQEAVSNVVNQDMMYNAFMKALNDGNTNFNVYLDGKQITDGVTTYQKRRNRAYGV